MASSNSVTVFQGVSGASALSAGMFLNMDGAIQSDGSLLATRVELEDSSAINDSSGPLMTVDNEVPILTLYGRTEFRLQQCRVQYLRPAYESSESAVRSQLQCLKHGGGPECRHYFGELFNRRADIYSCEHHRASPADHQWDGGRFAAERQLCRLHRLSGFLRFIPYVGRAAGTNDTSQQSEPNRGLRRQQRSEAEHAGTCAGQRAALLWAGVQR